jgi:DNA-binding transcriptional LysR family regulator
MKVDDLLLFARVASAGSYTAVAKELRMPKSTVSRRISELEEALGVRLIQRTTRTMGLTEMGRNLLPHALRIASEVDAAKSAIAGMDEKPRGALRVTIPGDFELIPGVIARFLVAYPEVEVELYASDRLIDLVADGFDVGIRVGTLRDSTLVARSLGKWSSFLSASPGYIEAHGMPTSPEELADHACLLFGPVAVNREWTLLDGDEREVTVGVSGPLFSNDLGSLEAAAVAGLGVAMIPGARGPRALVERGLVRVLPDWATRPVTLHAVYPSRRHLSPTVKAFVDWMAAELRP